MDARIDKDGNRRLTVKSSIAVTEFAAVVATATNDEIDLPAGDASLLFLGVALEAGTGTASGSVKVDVATEGDIPMIAGAAIAAGKTVVTKSTAGKVMEGTTAGAVIGRALTNASADGDMVIVRLF